MIQTVTPDTRLEPNGSASDPAVAVTELVKTYPHPEGGTFNAVDHISFTVERGEVFGFLGPNGAGKSTTLEIIEGLTTPTSGHTVVLGLDTIRDAGHVKQRIGVQLQASSYFEYLTLEELLELFGSFYPTPVPPQQLLDKVGLLDKRKALVGQLSGGQAQRFSIVAAMVNDPDVVFLDEPTTGLDPQSRRNLWDLIQQINVEDAKTVILTTHYMDEAEYLSHRVAIIDSGRIQAIDRPDRLIADLATHHVVRFVAGQDVELDELRRLPGATGAAVRRNGHLGYEVSTRSPKETVPALFHFAAARRFDVDELEVHAPTLEDVFLNITGRSLRD